MSKHIETILSLIKQSKYLSAYNYTRPLLSKKLHKHKLLNTLFTTILIELKKFDEIKDLNFEGPLSKYLYKMLDRFDMQNPDALSQHEMFLFKILKYESCVGDASCVEQLAMAALFDIFVLMEIDDGVLKDRVLVIKKELEDVGVKVNGNENGMDPGLDSGAEHHESVNDPKESPVTKKQNLIKELQILEAQITSLKSDKKKRKETALRVLEAALKKKAPHPSVILFLAKNNILLDFVEKNLPVDENNYYFLTLKYLLINGFYKGADEIEKLILLAEKIDDWDVYEYAMKKNIIMREADTMNYKFYQFLNQNKNHADKSYDIDQSYDIGKSHYIDQCNGNNNDNDTTDNYNVPSKNDSLNFFYSLKMLDQIQELSKFINVNSLNLIYQIFLLSQSPPPHEKLFIGEVFIRKGIKIADSKSHKSDNNYTTNWGLSKTRSSKDAEYEIINILPIAKIINEQFLKIRSDGKASPLKTDGKASPLKSDVKASPTKLEEKSSPLKSDGQPSPLKSDVIISETEIKMAIASLLKTQTTENLLLALYLCRDTWDFAIIRICIYRRLGYLEGIKRLAKSLDVKNIQMISLSVLWYDLALLTNSSCIDIFNEFCMAIAEINAITGHYYHRNMYDYVVSLLRVKYALMHNYVFREIKRQTGLSLYDPGLGTKTDDNDKDWDSGMSNSTYERTNNNSSIINKFTNGNIYSNPTNSKSLNCNLGNINLNQILGNGCEFLFEKIVDITQIIKLEDVEKYVGIFDNDFLNLLREISNYQKIELKI